MYRPGWATKPGQECVLAVKITREGFEWALAHAALSHYEPGTYMPTETADGPIIASIAAATSDQSRPPNLVPIFDMPISFRSCCSAQPIISRTAASMAHSSAPVRQVRWVPRLKMVRRPDT